MGLSGKKEWILNEFDAECLAIGVAMLGSGGGGSAYLGKIQLLDLIRKNPGKVRIISPDSLKEDEETMYVAYYGAPLVIIEKIPGTEACILALNEMIDHCAKNGKNVKYLTSAEIGGCNSIIPLTCGCMMGMPIVDGDFMGRAFPQI